MIPRRAPSTPPAIALRSVGHSPAQDWRRARQTMATRLREIDTVDQRYALIRFHATRAEGGGWITEPDNTGDLAASHQFEVQCVGLSGTGRDKAELVRNFQSVLANALKGGTA